MNILVTGATGFTGGKLAVHLAKQGHRIRALARSGADTSELTPHDIEIVQGDITDADAVHRAVQGVEQVYHIAACFRTAGHPDSYYHEVNVEGTRHVLDAAKKFSCERVVHCSTIGVHGSVEQIPADETAPFAPGDIYQKTKLEGEILAAERQKQGQPIAIFRPASIYGPGDRRLLKLFKQVLGGWPMLGAGQVNFHLVYIDDLVAGIELCGQKQEALGEVFILCGPDYVPLNTLFKLVADSMNVSPPRWRLPAGPFYAASLMCEALCVPFGIEPPLHRRRVGFFTKNRSFTCEKASRMLGYEPKISAETGVHRTAQWYFEQSLLERAVGAGRTRNGNAA